MLQMLARCIGANQSCLMQFIMTFICFYFHLTISAQDLIEDSCPFKSAPAIVPYIRGAFSARHPATQNGASFFQKLLLILDLMGPPSHFDVGGMCRYRLLVGAGCSLHVRVVVDETRIASRVLRRIFSSPGERKLWAVSSLLLH